MSVSFQRQMEKIAQEIDRRGRQLVRNVDDHVGRSIMFGSHVTGAPGQPVKSGELLASWRRNKSGPYMTSWISRKPYAIIIEHNLRGAQLRSKVGGFHSVKLTRHGFHAIVRYELGRLDRGSRDRSGRLRDAGGRFVSG